MISTFPLTTIVDWIQQQQQNRRQKRTRIVSNHYCHHQTRSSQQQQQQSQQSVRFRNNKLKNKGYYYTVRRIVCYGSIGIMILYTIILVRQFPDKSTIPMQQKQKTTPPTTYNNDNNIYHKEEEKDPVDSSVANDMTNEIVKEEEEEKHDTDDVTSQRRPIQLLRQRQQYLYDQKRIHVLPTLPMVYTEESVITYNTTDMLMDDAFIIFNANIPGQGTGNLISGLLAAHLLGDEFHRIVCINPIYYQIFLDSFELIDPIVVQKCTAILNAMKDYFGASTAQQYNQRHLYPNIDLINFMGAADECNLQNYMLNRRKYPVIQLVANTYPRWPPVPTYYFLQFYQPKLTLLNILPYQEQPEIVIHLREPDNKSVDPRKGLDALSLNALSEMIPKSSTPFLVSNNVKYYQYFTNCCEWAHPQWDVIYHSATDQAWIPKDYTSNSSTAAVRDVSQTLRMWSDWYTILMADSVYHTHSDFSVSAIHWMNNYQSYSLKEYNTITQQLETTVESWWYDGETIPLRNRTIDGIPNTTNELRGCYDYSLKVTKERESTAEQQN